MLGIIGAGNMASALQEAMKDVLQRLSQPYHG